MGDKCRFLTCSKSSGKLLFIGFEAKTESNLANRFSLPLFCKNWKSFELNQVFHFSVYKERQLSLEMLEQIFSTFLTRTFKFKPFSLNSNSNSQFVLNSSVIKNANFIRDHNKPKGKQSIWLQAEMKFIMISTKRIYIFLQLQILLLWLLPWSFNQKKNQALHFSVQMVKQVCLYSGFGWEYYGSEQVTWSTLIASLLGLLLKSLSQESFCKRCPFRLSPPAATVEPIERESRCTSCV